eukprot:GFKZ01003162.1.p1 GENE.GFKZ01003162.1~~GFKZ01003162.1.p1  ORF type:complete len:194 (+),score=25.60 GFKZ01003162.1:271-852(+)
MVFRRRSDAKACRYAQPESFPGSNLEGREILLCWDDGVWYEAIVVCYYPDLDEYKLVYRSDDAIEITRLRDRRWVLAPKKHCLSGETVLDGAIIEFEYPNDGKKYRAMIYDYSHHGDRLKIAYIDEHSTDNLKGGGWTFVTSSPCKVVVEEPKTDEAPPKPAPKSDPPGKVITKRSARPRRKSASSAQSITID